MKKILLKVDGQFDASMNDLFYLKKIKIDELYMDKLN